MNFKRYIIWEELKKIFNGWKDDISELPYSFRLPQLLDTSLNLLSTRAGRREKQEKKEVRESGRASLPTMRIRPNFRSINVKENGNPAPGPEGSPHPLRTVGGGDVHSHGEGGRWELLLPPCTLLL